MASTPIQARPVRRNGLLLHPMPGLVRIARSVGQGGVNNRADALAIQVALNAVPAAFAGADGALAEDGLAGPKTCAAIKAFQARWLRVVDSRADPAGPTLRTLNDMAGVFCPAPGLAPRPAPPPHAFAAPSAFAPRQAGPPKPPAPPKPAPPAVAQAIADAISRHQRIYSQHLPLIVGWLNEALQIAKRALAYAEALAAPGAAQPPMPAGSAERRAFLLLAKYFRLHETRPAPALAAARRVARILQDMTTLAAFQSIQQPPATPGGPDFRIFVCLWKQPRIQLSRDDGYSYAGGVWAPGWNRPSGWINDAEVDRRVHQEFTHQIFLLPSFDARPPDMQRMALIHEMAHAAGPENEAHSVGIEPEHYTHEQAFAALTSAQRLRTADAYAAFTMDLALGTRTAIAAQQSNSTILPVYPETNMLLDLDGTRHIAMPPAGHPMAAQLAWPGGFP